MNTTTKGGAPIASLLDRLKAAIGQSLESKAPAVLSEGGELLAACDDPLTLHELAANLAGHARAITAVRNRERLQGSRDRWEDSDDAASFHRVASVMADRLSQKARAIEADESWRAKREGEAEALASKVAAAKQTADATAKTMREGFATVRAVRAERALMDELAQTFEARLIAARERFAGARDRAADRLIAAAIDGTDAPKLERIETAAAEVAALEAATTRVQARRDAAAARLGPEEAAAETRAGFHAEARHSLALARILEAVQPHRELFEEWAACAAWNGGNPAGVIVLPINSQGAGLRLEVLRHEVKP